MPVAFLGKSGTAADVDGTTFRAQKITRRPSNYECYGQYNIAAVTGILAAALAANSQIFQFVWSDPDAVALISYLAVTFQPETLFTANTLTDFGFDIRRIRQATAGSGGTDLTPANSGVGINNAAKMRTSMGTSRAVGIRIATTAALTPVTNFDSNSASSSMGMFQRVNPTAGVTEEQYNNIPTLEYQPRMTRGEMPMLLQDNEAVVVRSRGVWPAAGTGIAAINFRWSEFDKTKF